MFVRLDRIHELNVTDKQMIGHLKMAQAVLMRSIAQQKCRNGSTVSAVAY